MENIYQQIVREGRDFYLFAEAASVASPLHNDECAYYVWDISSQEIRKLPGLISDQLERLDSICDTRYKDMFPGDNVEFERLRLEKPIYEVVSSYAEMIQKISDILKSLEVKEGLFSRTECAGDHPLGCDAGADLSPDKFVVLDAKDVVVEHCLIKKVEEVKELTPIEIEGEKILEELINESIK